jgi:hypothetical protein
MGDARIVYGLAYGKQGNWYSTWQNKTHGLLAQANTAPDVTTGYLFYTANTTATTITDFKLSAPGSPDTGGNIAPLFEGKTIKVWFTDSLTTISGARIFLSSSDSTPYQNSVIDFMYHNSSWYEIDRTNARPTTVTVAAAGSTSVNVNNAEKIVILSGTATPVVLTSISGGYVGQSIIVMGASGGCALWVNSNGNIVLPGTSQFAIASSASLFGGVALTKVNATQWAIGNGGW